MKPLFIPLKTEYFEAFKAGTKTVEYRKFGDRWNDRTCQPGRSVILSKGYGKGNRMTGTIVSFDMRFLDTKEWRDCYGAAGYAACIGITLNG